MSGPIGILGGTFDPVHHGHLRLALECHGALQLDRVKLVPLNRPAHRGPVHASSEHRLAMLRLAADKVSALEVDDIEIRRGGTSWTIDTVTEYRRQHGEQPLCLIMGMDAFQSLHLWKEWQLIPEQVHIIVAARPGTNDEFDNPLVAELYNTRRTDFIEDIHSSPAGRILKINIPTLAISSTRIRSLLTGTASAAFLLPDSVLAYIKQHRIYPGLI
jgi:nicotinate-nucleotide adenylyltransferase